MKKKEILLKELIKQVIQKDQEIEARHEKEAIKNATKEALIEMTEMSLEEINKIETEISHSYKIKEKNKRDISIFFLIVGLISGILLYFFLFIPLKSKIGFKKNFKDTLVFEENFNDNSKGWTLYNNKTKNTSIENGRYIFQTINNDGCIYSMLPLEIKKNAIIKLKSTWIDGWSGYYGLKLEETARDFYVFEITSGGKVCFVKQVNGKANFHYYDLEIGRFGYGKTSMEQTVILKGKVIEYYINAQLIHTEKSRRLSVNKIGFSICKNQIVAFEKLRVWE